MSSIVKLLRASGLIVLLGASTLAFAQPATLISNTVELRGQPATVSAAFLADGSVIVADVVIGFDPLVLLPMPDPCSSMVFACEVTAPDRLRMTAVDLDNPLNSEAISISFQVLAIAPGGSSPIEIISEDYSDGNGIPVPSQNSADGAVNVRILPGFRVGRVGGASSETITVPLRLVTGTESAASGVFEFSFDQTALSATENCFSGLGTVFLTHTIECTVNNTSGRVTVSFESATFPVEQSTSGDRNLGDIDFAVLQAPADPSIADGYDLTIVSHTLRDVDRNPISDDDQYHGEIRVFEAWPLDEYEEDNVPLEGTSIATTFGLPEFVTQVRSFRVDGDDEWIMMERPPCSASHSVVELSSPFGSRAPETFIPRVELYSFDRLELLLPPFASFGDCGVTEGPTRIVIPPQGLYDNTMMRIRNCGPVPAGGITYNLTIRVPGNACPVQDIARLGGTVTEAGSGQPVSVFLVSDNNQATVSSPTSGNWEMAELPEEAITISVSSSIFTAAPILVPAVQGGSSDLDNHIVVTRRGAVFSNGFESTR